MIAARKAKVLEMMGNAGKTPVNKDYSPTNDLTAKNFRLPKIGAGRPAAITPNVLSMEGTGYDEGDSGPPCSGIRYDLSMDENL